MQPITSSLTDVDQSQSGETDLEKEIQNIRDQTVISVTVIFNIQTQKLVEFDALKSALFKDLENRCQKVYDMYFMSYIDHRS